MNAPHPLYDSRPLPDAAVGARHYLVANTATLSGLFDRFTELVTNLVVDADVEGIVRLKLHEAYMHAEAAICRTAKAMADTETAP